MWVRKVSGALLIGGVVLANPWIGQAQVTPDEARIAAASAEAKAAKAVKESSDRLEAARTALAAVEGADPDKKYDDQPDAAKAAKRYFDQAKTRSILAVDWKNAADAALSAAQSMVNSAERKKSAEKEKGDAEAELEKAKPADQDSAQAKVDQKEEEVKKAATDYTSAQKSYTQKIAAANDMGDRYAAESTDVPEEPWYSTTHWFIEAGVAALAPYTIKSTTKDDDGQETDPAVRRFFLEDSGAADLKGYLQFRLRKRDAWENARKTASRTPAFYGPCSTREDPGFSLCKCWKRLVTNPSNDLALLHPDYDVRFGFNYGQGGGTSATAIAGAGDFYLSTSAGFPFISVQTAGTEHTINLEGVYELATDRGVQDVHNRLGIGVAWAMGWALRPLIADRTVVPDRVYELSLRPSVNIMESPHLSSEDKSSSEDKFVVVDGVEKPRVKSNSSTRKADFKTRHGVFGLDLDLQLPYGKYGYLTLGASVFSDHHLQPAPWTLRLGTTLPIAKILEVLTLKQ